MVFAYIVASIAFAVSGGIKAGIMVGFYTILASKLAIVSSAGLKSFLFLGNVKQKVLGSLAAAALMALALWLGAGFSVIIFGLRLSGAEWAWVGFLFGCLFVPSSFSGIGSMVCLLAMCLLSGCIAPTQWEKAGATDMDFKRDFYPCVRDSLATNPNSDLASVAIAYAMRDMCMESKGWTKVNR